LAGGDEEMFMIKGTGAAGAGTTVLEQRLFKDPQKILKGSIK